MVVLAGLVVLNVLAWWWFTRGGESPAPSEAAAPSVATPLPGTKPVAAPPAAPAPSAPVIAAPAAEPQETILSVLPARAPRTAAPAASAAVPTAAGASAPARAPALDAAATPRIADATAGRVPAKPAAALAESIDPRARCGDRNFISMLVCIKRECADPAVSAHAECVKLREQEAQTRSER
jgi:hypothetical protein